MKGCQTYSSTLARGASCYRSIYLLHLSLTGCTWCMCFHVRGKGFERMPDIIKHSSAWSTCYRSMSVLHLSLIGCTWYMCFRVRGKGFFRAGGQVLALCAGELVEWDLAQRRPRATSDSLGGAVWALAVEPAGSADAGTTSSSPLCWLGFKCTCALG